MSRELTGYSKKQGEGRRPFLYSEEYNHWNRAAKSGSKHAAEAAADAWNRKFRVRRQEAEQ